MPQAFEDCSDPSTPENCGWVAVHELHNRGQIRLDTHEPGEFDELIEDMTGETPGIAWNRGLADDILEFRERTGLPVPSATLSCLMCQKCIKYSLVPINQTEITIVEC